MTSIDQLIAGPDPLMGETFDANSVEGTEIFDRVTMGPTSHIRFTPRIRNGVIAATGIATVAATVMTLTLGSVGSPVMNAAAAEMTKLASNAASAPALQGRYVILSETDTQAGVAGEFQRTSVIDTETGASTTYQFAAALDGVAPSSDYTSAPSVLTEGSDPTSSETWFAALPTDPTALSAKLLQIAKQQVAESDAQLAKLQRTTGEKAFVQQPTLSDDDYIYQEADTLLWSPLVEPDLRSALYEVLASMSGYSVNETATDPSGRTAIAMTRTYSGTNETDTTYEDPTTGAVLAQTWNGAGGDITAVYQPVTSTNVPPSDPYPSN
jgi:hypothetical protein